MSERVPFTPEEKNDINAMLPKMKEILADPDSLRLFSLVSMFSVHGIDRCPELERLQMKYLTLLLWRCRERGIFFKGTNESIEEDVDEVDQYQDMKCIHEGLLRTLADLKKMAGYVQIWCSTLMSS